MLRCWDPKDVGQMPLGDEGKTQTRSHHGWGWWPRLRLLATSSRPRATAP